MSIADRKQAGTWFGRSLDNYKAMHKKTAESKDVSQELASARTLTQARKVLFGLKKGNTKAK